MITTSDMTPNVLGYNFMASDLTAGTTAGVRSDGSGFLALDLTVLDFWVYCRPSDLTAGKASDKTLSPAKLCNRAFFDAA